MGGPERPGWGRLVEDRVSIAEQHMSLSDLACEAIRRRVRDGEYERGARLAESGLGEELGMSRPIREVPAASGR